MHKCHKPNHLWICSLYSNICSHIHRKFNIALDTFIHFPSHKSYKYFYLYCTILYCFTYLEKDSLTAFKNMVILVHLLTWTIWPSLYLFIYLTFSFKKQKTVEIVAERGNMSVLSCLTWTDRRKGADPRSPGPPPLGNPMAGILRQRALDLKVLPKASGPLTCEADIPESLAANGARHGDCASSSGVLSWWKEGPCGNTGGAAGFRVEGLPFGACLACATWAWASSFKPHCFVEV